MSNPACIKDTLELVNLYREEDATITLYQIRKIVQSNLRTHGDDWEWAQVAILSDWIKMGNNTY